METFIDEDYAPDKVTRSSQTKKVPLVMYSKKQNSVQTSTFGSHFMTMRQAVEMVQAFRYITRHIGVPLDGGANLCYGNEAVYKISRHVSKFLLKYLCKSLVIIFVIKLQS